MLVYREGNIFAQMVRTSSVQVDEFVKKMAKCVEEEEAELQK